MRFLKSTFRSFKRQLDRLIWTGALGQQESEQVGVALKNLERSIEGRDLKILLDAIDSISKALQKGGKN